MNSNNQKRESSNISIRGKHVEIKGDVIGGDKITTNYNYPYADIASEFRSIRELIDQQKNNKDELRETVEQIHQEVQKGENANADKIENWLRFLGQMSDDIFQVTVSCLASPIVGIAKAVQLIAKKAKEEKQSE